MACGNAYVNFMFMALPWAMVPFRCQLEVQFAHTGPGHKYKDRYMHVPFTCTAPVHFGQG